MKFPEHECGLFLIHNEHKNYYQSVEEWIEENEMYQWENDESKQKAIELNEVWSLQWYPDTPIGFCSIASHTIYDLLRFANED